MQIKRKWLRNNPQSLNDLYENIKQLNTYTIEIPGDEKEKEHENIWRSKGQTFSKIDF